MTLRPCASSCSGSRMEATLAERPILFSAPMVRALLAGTKTQTRRAIVSRKRAAPYFVVYADKDGGNPRPVYSGDGERGHYIDTQGFDVEERMQCPYGHTGDRLWVREAFSGLWLHKDKPPSAWEPTDDMWYWADGNPDYGDWTPPKPSIHMPRWASRILLEVTGVRVERLQEISMHDVAAEGVESRHVTGRGTVWGGNFGHWKGAYADLWESINGPGSWDANPWVWAISFVRHDAQAMDLHLRQQNVRDAVGRRS